MRGKRKLLRRVVLGMLLSTSYMGSVAADVEYPITGGTISGTHDLQGKESLFYITDKQEVKATSDVSVVSKWQNGTNTKYLFYGEYYDSMLDLDMNSHSLSIESDPAIFYVRGGDIQLNIHGADTIEATADAGHIINVSGGSGTSAGIQAKNDIQLNQAGQKDSGASITVSGGSNLNLDAGHDIVIQNDGPYDTVGIGSGSDVKMNAGHNIIFSRRDVEMWDNMGDIDIWDKASLQMDAGTDITFNKGHINVWRESALQMNAGNNITFDKAKILAQNGATIQLDADNDIVFNKTNDESDSSSLHVDANGKATLKAGKDILFNRDQDGTFIELSSGGTAEVKTEEGNILFHEDQAGNSTAIKLNNSSNLQIAAQTIKGNMQRLAEASYYGVLSFKAKNIEWVAQGQEVEPSGRGDETSMVVSASGSRLEFEADNTLTLSTEVAPTLIHTSGGDVTMSAGDLISLHNAGNDSGYTDYYTDDGDDYDNEYHYNYDHKYQANLWAESGQIDLTTDGLISVDNKGSVAALTEYDGVINFNGNTILSEAGIGAKSEAGGNINFNGDTVMSKVGIGVWAETDRDYADEEKSTITFNGDLEIDQAETGAVAQYDSDIIFNKGLKIQAEDNAFYAESAGRIQTLTEDVDKVIKGDMRAYNGQIDALFDTADSSFTGFTELREIKKVYSYDEDDDEYSDEGTCPIDPDPGCQEPSVDEGARINITLRNEAFWDVTGDSSLTKLENDSLVNMSDADHTGTSITAKNLSGTGTMVMDLDWNSNGGVKEKTDNSDYITVTESATGTQAIVSDPSTMHLDEMGIKDRLYFATLTDSDAVFTSPITQQHAPKGGLYDYIIGINSETTDNITDWFFGTISSSESPVVDTGRINSQIMYDLATDMDTLNKRMGDVRYITTDPDGLWARTTYTHNDHDSYSGHSNRFEVGKDYVTSRDDGSTVHKGVSFTYLHSNASFTEGNGKYDRYTGSLYYTWLGNNGPYVDVVGRIGKLNGDNRIFLVNGDESESSFGTWYQQGSVEAGRNYDLKDGWYIEPQAQLQYTHMNSKNYTGNDGIGYRSDGVNSLIGRVGFRLGNHIDANRSWYVKGDILHEFSGDGGVIFTSANGLERIEYTRDGKDTWYDIGAGLNAELSHDRSLWFEFERKFSGSYKNSWEFNAGMSWKF